jgi:hypothetical protein
MLTSIVNAEFIVNNKKNIVTDTVLNLEWQNNLLVRNVSFQKEPIGEYMSHVDAIEYCKQLDLDGMGWRLPTLNELKSIMDKTDKVFSNTLNFYWTSSIPADNAGKYTNNAVYVVDFKNKKIAYHDKRVLRYVRCVRDK